MKLKPSLLQFIVIGMTISLLASCTRVPETSQINCNSHKHSAPMNAITLAVVVAVAFTMGVLDIDTVVVVEVVQAIPRLR